MDVDTIQAASSLLSPKHVTYTSIVTILRLILNSVPSFTQSLTNLPTQTQSIDWPYGCLHIDGLFHNYLKTCKKANGLVCLQFSYQVWDFNHRFISFCANKWISVTGHWVTTVQRLRMYIHTVVRWLVWAIYSTNQSPKCVDPITRHIHRRIRLRWWSHRFTGAHDNSTEEAYIADEISNCIACAYNTKKMFVFLLDAGHTYISQRHAVE